jgi:hypothetical protein
MQLTQGFSGCRTLELNLTIFHSDIIPEHSCDGELVQLDRIPLPYIGSLLVASYSSWHEVGWDSDLMHSWLSFVFQLFVH